MSKKIIWSLFDSETAITQQLNSDEYIVYSIGLPSSSAITSNFIHIDLSKRNCLKKLSKIQKPNIIFASPPCETWVTVNIGSCYYYKRNYNEYNLYWQRNFKSNKFKRIFEERRLNGQRTAYWTAKIIKVFNPALWVIENGSSSLIFKYLNNYHNLEGNKNKTFYSSYDPINFGRKPTTFYSNIKMNLRTDYKKGSKVIVSERVKDRKEGVKYLNDYCERSAVPIQLYKHVLNIFEGKEQLTLF